MADKFLEDVFDRFDAMDSRKTWNIFQTKYNETANKWNEAREAFAKLAEGKGSEFAEPFTKAREELMKIADRDIRGIFVPKNGTGKEQFSKAKKTFDDARVDLVQYFKGQKKDAPVSEDITKAFNDADDVGRSVINTLEGWGMKFKLEGAQNTIKDNLKFLDEEVIKNRKGAVYARVGFTGVGALAMGHALFVSKTADGDDRSVLARVAEGAVGATLVGASALAGGAR